ncbi:ImmA/IrrE family metallo-endopeptidase [Sporosarcina sp. 179-K 3D1 HS]|uniref:ImmA/IrrE family metallo-endopeptidase n=1 Tax=Sporosarcina sp. 179-K 3D1 HS TaxID=3232169 RepID=UPI0039A15579
MKVLSLSLLEEQIFSIYTSLNISHPSQICHNELIDLTANKFHIRVYYFDEASEANNLGGIYRIFLNENQTKQQIWQDFAHELGHILRHEGYQWSMEEPFREYQEWQAENFAHHFCVPTFMLDRLDLPRLRCEAVWLIASLFNVETTFANDRLEKWLRNRATCYLADSYK